jgi:hypothetical protein
MGLDGFGHHRWSVTTMTYCGVFAFHVVVDALTEGEFGIWYGFDFIDITVGKDQCVRSARIFWDRVRAIRKLVAE